MEGSGLFKSLFGFRPRMRSEWLSILTAVYVLSFLNATFWNKSFAYLNGDAMALLALGVGILAIFVALFVSLSVKYLTKPVLILFVLASVSGAWFMDRFGVIIDSEMVRNVVETNQAEAGHLITSAFIMHMVIFGLLPSLLIATVEIVHRPILKKVGVNLLIIIPCLAVFALAGYSHSGTFMFNIRQHRDWFHTLNPLFPMGSAVKLFIRKGEEQTIIAQPLGTDAKVADDRKSVDRKPRVTVVVVGETARAANFQLGGYGRETNPELSKRDILYFKNTSSCGTATAVSVPCMFSVYGRQDYSHSKALASEDLMDVLTHAGVKTEWWDNNTGDKQVADRIKKIEFFRSGDPRFCSGGECLDQILVDGLDAWLDKVDGDAVLVLHQLGNHGPAYYLRYPEEFRTFTPDCRTVDFDACTPETITNAYDNALLYTDHILSEVIDKLGAHADRLDTAMIYMSDHGESLGEKGLYLHGAPYMFAPDEQTHVPFVLWTSPGLRQSTGIDTSCLSAKTDAHQSQDELFHSVLGLMRVETKVYDPSLDIFASCRDGVSS
ncbi:phosphoethanolamine transferase [Pseudohoeflea suaedae]|uniref:Phosphoethanolamine transferase n=1 Tax=Pseudohoeflea suaedae TaxID=877384 RepID=A0A4R5PPL5_9HYPH|nr:phosphoethanolamine--lipid A transferase [Pseudohoeflea suaedae]TDH38557.1 phosphoethanolamine transferase [Pseudohoeflea suaedae]